VSRLDELLDALPRWILVVGKGGVGKTTCAAGVAAQGAARGEDTLLLSTDPARSLGAALGERVGSEPARVKTRDHLFAMQLDAQYERDRFLAQWRDLLVTILDRGTYLSSEDVAGVVDDALPGVDEAMALLALLELERDARWKRIVVDTAPTGHTLRLLALPDTFRALVTLLDTMQNKHRFMVQALARRYRPDAADAFLSQVRDDIDALSGALVDPARTAAVLITRAEPMVVAETVRYAAALEALSIRIGAVVINAVDASQSAATRQAASALGPVAPHAKRLEVARAAVPPNGLDEIAALFADAGTRSTPASARRQGTTGTATHPAIATFLRPLTIVAGKGGVGKTTAACALGVSFARPEKPVLIVSSDPAPSVSDALGQAVPDEDVEVDGAPGCRARQMDATMAFERFRVRYVERVDAVFDRLMGGSLHLTYDKAVVRDLLALAPPGIDELYALVTLGELLADGRYKTIIVDPAPTGHLLRLLEMPALALAWTHRLMRLMIEYKEIGGLGEAAQELLDFARRTRALRELLTDPTRATVVVVANDEALVRDESGRLVSACRERGIDVGALVWNRVNDGVAPLSAAHPPRQFVAPTVSPAPRGAVALKRWCATWRPLEDEPFA
jgi:arsenite-transporting ATPase